MSSSFSFLGFLIGGRGAFIRRDVPDFFEDHEPHDVKDPSAEVADDRRGHSALRGCEVRRIPEHPKREVAEKRRRITADAEAAQSLTMVNNKLYIVDQSGISVKTIAFYNSWNSTRGELGALKSINEINVELNSKTGELCTITVDTSYEKNDKCTFEFVINDDYTLENGAINPSYTTGQKMYKAVMNTLIGMGTVFVVLIFISFIISLFTSFIPLIRPLFFKASAIIH